VLALAPQSLVKVLGFIFAFAALAIILLLPPIAGLKPSAQVMLAVLAFAIIVWITEAMDYSVSAVVIAALMIFLLAFEPDPGKVATTGTGNVAEMAPLLHSL
jgi:di/tricarboxylate transporter